MPTTRDILKASERGRTTGKGGATGLLVGELEKKLEEVEKKPVTIEPPKPLEPEDKVEPGEGGELENPFDIEDESSN